MNTILISVKINNKIVSYNNKKKNINTVLVREREINLSRANSLPYIQSSSIYIQIIQKTRRQTETHKHTLNIISILNLFVHLLLIAKEMGQITVCIPSKSTKISKVRSPDNHMIITRT